MVNLSFGSQNEGIKKKKAFSFTVVLTSLLIHFNSAAGVVQDYGYQLVGKTPDGKFEQNLELILADGQEDSNRYSVVMVGCGTECSVYQAVVDFTGRKVYVFDEVINALVHSLDRSEITLLEPDFILDYEQVVVNGTQYVFGDLSGPMAIRQEGRLSGKEIQSARAYADRFVQNPSRENYVGVIVGCGTQCMSLTAVISVLDWSIIELDSNIDAIGAFERPAFFGADGRSFIFDGEVVRERK